MSSKGLRFLVMLLLLALIQACATRPVYRPPLPSRSPVPSDPSSPQSSLPPPRAPVSPPRPLPEEPTIKEQDLKEKRPAPQERSKEQRTIPTPGSEPASLPDDSSLIAKITPQTPPQRAASLRLTEEGRKIMDSGDYAKALSRLEKTISIDSTNPYGYYYLAKAHYHLAHYQESINFLDVAESYLGGQSYWLAEVLALKGENYRALGFSQKADSVYSEALRLNPGNRVASEGLSRMRGDIQPPTY